MKHKSRQGSVLVQKSGHVDDDVQFSALDASTGRMDEEVVTSERCWSGIEMMPEISRRSELDEWVENWTCLNALERKFWKIKPMILMDEKRRKTWKSNQKIEMDGGLDHNIVKKRERRDE